MVLAPCIASILNSGCEQPLQNNNEIMHNVHRNDSSHPQEVRDTVGPTLSVVRPGMAECVEYEKNSLVY